MNLLYCRELDMKTDNAIITVRYRVGATRQLALLSMKTGNSWPGNLIVMIRLQENNAPRQEKVQQITLIETTTFWFLV